MTLFDSSILVSYKEVRKAKQDHSLFMYFQFRNYLSKQKNEVKTSFAFPLNN